MAPKTVAKLGAAVSIAAGLALLMAGYSTHQAVFYALAATSISLGTIQYHAARRSR